MRRRDFIAAIWGGATAFAPLVSAAQPATKIPRIGFLLGNLTTGPHLLNAFRQVLRYLGYVEGGNVIIEYREAARDFARLPQLAADLAAKVDVIVAVSTMLAIPAKQATATIPIVFIAAGDPVTRGLVASLRRPEGNVTGLSAMSPELVGKALELLKETLPEIKRMAILWQPGSLGDSDKEMLEEAEAAGKAAGVQLQIVQARGPADIDSAFSEITSQRAGALVVVSTPMFAAERTRLIELTIKNRLPTVFQFRLYVDADGLMSYGPDLADLFRRAATYVDKILKGSKPADLPVERPTKFELVINLKTATALGLRVPAPILFRADEVIE
jgi:putative tryptophan/tyrosine transport system substrate-binding protein